MPIQVKIMEPGCVPVPVCDHCGQEIVFAEDGNQTWEVDGRGNPVGDRLFFTHKDCQAAFEDTHGGKDRWLADELMWFPILVADSLGLTWDPVHGWAAAECDGGLPTALATRPEDPEGQKGP